MRFDALDLASKRTALNTFVDVDIGFVVNVYILVNELVLHILHTVILAI